MATPRQGLTHLDPTVSFEQSNIALLGSEIDHHLKAESAKHEPAFVAPGLGTRPGTWGWRVEDFKLVAWKNHDQLGTGDFYDGDSYLLLKSTAPVPSKPEVLLHEIHFWLGNKTSSDEAGVATYKAVELDKFLGGKPIQYRNTQGSESSQFLSLFHPNFTVLQGGHVSGFHHVSPSTPASLHFSQPRLWEISLAVPERQGAHRHTRVQEALSLVESIHQDCVYILDSGDTLLQWNGTDSHSAKAKGAQVARFWCDAREGKAKLEVFDQGSGDSAFFLALGCTPASIPTSFPTHVSKMTAERTPPKVHDLLSSPPRALAPSTISRHSLQHDPPSLLILIATSRTHFVWVADELPKEEKRRAILVAQRTVGTTVQNVSHGIVRVIQGEEGEEFWYAVEDS